MFHSIKYLERTGHLTYSEEVDIPAKVRIKVDRKSLYDIEVPTQELADLLDILMRTYPAVFSFVQPIDEDYIAGRLGTTVPQLRMLLYDLSLEHIITYVPADHSDVVVIHHDRLRPGNVDLMPERYRSLRENYHLRSEAMIEYASETDECRPHFLLRYFGQEDSKECGVCDVCRSRASLRSTVSIPSSTTAQFTRMKLQEFISEREGEYTIEEIVAEFGNPSKDYSPDYLSILRQLIDDGTVPVYS